MSKLDDICYRMYETSGNSKYIRAEWAGKPYHPDTAKQDVKDLLFQLMAEVREETDGIYNLFEPYLIKKIDEL